MGRTRVDETPKSQWIGGRGSNVFCVSVCRTVGVSGEGVWVLETRRGGVGLGTLFHPIPTNHLFFRSDAR